MNTASLAQAWSKIKSVGSGSTTLGKWGIGLIILLTGILAFGLGRLSRLEEGRAPIKFESWLATSSETLGPLATTTQNVKSQSRDGASLLPGQGGLASPVTNPSSQPAGVGNYVASKNGKKYYLPWCGTAKRIKVENQIWFATKADAEAAGYMPAANCPGI